MKNDLQQTANSTGFEEYSSDAAKPRSCCAPRVHREEPVSHSTVVLAPFVKTRDRVPGSDRSVIALLGGSFLMGTNYAHGFPADCEGPVRPVSLSAFDLDTFPVANEYL